VDIQRRERLSARRRTATNKLSEPIADDQRRLGMRFERLTFRTVVARSARRRVAGS
jgi:hypothetical protein